MQGFLRHTPAVALLFGLAALAPEGAAAQETGTRDTIASGAAQDTIQLQNPPGYQGMERAGGSDSASGSNSLAGDSAAAKDSARTDSTRVGDSEPRVPAAPAARPPADAAEPTGQPAAPGAGATGP